MEHLFDGKNKDKKLLLGFLLAEAMLCAACGGNTLNNTGSQSDMEQLSENETDTDDTAISESTQPDTESLSEDADTDAAKEFLKQFANIEKQSEELKNSMDHEDMSQTEYNFKAHDLYTLWDNALNDLWQVLGTVLSDNDMHQLTAEEQAWIKDRDQKISEAGEGVDGGSMQPMVEDLTGAKLTEKRVRELLTYIQNSPDTASSATDSEASSEQETQTDLFADFLYHGGMAKVADDFNHDNRMIENVYHAGDVIDFAELTDFLRQNEMLSGSQPQVAYACLKNSSRKAYALRFYYETDTEGFTQFFILSENRGELAVNFAIDGWSRRSATINENGVIFDSGSNGAGSHESITYVPDLNFTYKVLSNTEENAYGYSFYDANGQPAQAINDIMNEAAMDNPEAMNVLYSQVVIDGRAYYYFLGIDGITQDLVNDIDEIARLHGFTFDGKAAADAAELAYAQKLGAEEIYNKQTPAVWRELSVGDNNNISQ